jgi:hypothetical protein
LYDGGEWKVEFRGELSSRQLMEWDELYSKLMEVEIRDAVVWALEKKGSILYKIVVQIPKLWWGYSIGVPLKVRIFMWQMYHDKI